MGLPKDTDVTGATRPNIEHHFIGEPRADLGDVLNQDVDLVEAVQRIAGNGTGDTRWKVPGVLDWSTGVYNPDVEISRDTTTLYASDRDVFLFLVDDHNPIEAGRLPDGSPDLYFRGFYCWNSEVGAKTLGMASFYLRAVCQNRNLWGVEGFNELTFKHTSGAPDKFLEEAIPSLLQYSNAGTGKLLTGINAARTTLVADTDEERLEFLTGKWGFSVRAAREVMAIGMVEEGHPPASVWDFAQAITALARGEQFQDARVALERIAGKMLSKVKV
jgi:hypothetical protein